MEMCEAVPTSEASAARSLVTMRPTSGPPWGALGLLERAARARGVTPKAK